MQLKDEFRTYDALRREHDAQIVQIATEAGLRIAPDQWSSLLYGDSAHKSHMQSIIDKLQTPQSFGQSVQELVIALQRTSDPHNLSNLRPSLELLAALDPSPDAPLPGWPECESTLEAARLVVRGLLDFVSSHSGSGGGGGASGGGGSQRSAVRGQSEQPGGTHGSHGVKYKTSLCRDLLRGGCPRGPNCTFAHSEEELDRYRSRHRKNSGKLCGGSRNGGEAGSLENLMPVGVDAAGIAMITDTSAGPDPITGFYCSPVRAVAGTTAAASANYCPSAYPYRYQYGTAAAAGVSPFPIPPPLPPSVYGAAAIPHVYSAPTLPPQPEYGMPAPVADYPIETARLIPSLASQSLVVLQNRKQEILDQLEKIGSHQDAQQSQQQRREFSMWNGVRGPTAATTTTAIAAGTSAYGRTGTKEDDDFIPFGAPLCSKYGPISRLSRIIPRPSNPIQAVSPFGHSLISTPVKRLPLTSTGRTLSAPVLNRHRIDDGLDRDGLQEEDGESDDEDCHLEREPLPSTTDEAPPPVASAPVTLSSTAAQRNFYAESERMKYELELLKQQIDELKMATLDAASLGGLAVSEGRQRLSRELHLIEER